MRVTSLLGHFFCNPGNIIDKLRVSSEIGGLGPNVSLVTTNFNIYESSIIHNIVLTIFDEAIAVTDDFPK